MKTVQTILSKRHKPIERILRKQGETDNLKGKILNHLMCECENDLLMKVKASGIINMNVLMFDGFMSDDVVDEDDILEKLNRISEHVNVKWSVKEHNIGAINGIMNIQKSDKVFVVGKYVNDLCDKLLADPLKNNLSIYDGTFYFKTDKKWIQGEKEVKRCLYSYCNDNDLIIEDKLVKENDKTCYSVGNALINLCINEVDVRSKVWHSTLDKICFKNGYYDFTDQAFKTDNNVDTFFRINRNFDLLNSNKKIRDEIYNRVLNPIFTVTDESSDRAMLRDHWLFNMVNRLAGNLGKEWNVMMGPRNCGKGVLSDFLSHTFEKYVGNGNIENFVVKEGVGDVAKSYSWIKRLEFCKLIMFHETKDKDNRNSSRGKISGSMIKKISGGDSLEVRTNHQDEIEVRLMGSLNIFCNDLEDICPADVNETRVNYNMTSKFLKPDEIIDDDSIYHQKQDKSLKVWITRPDVCDEFFRLLIDVYKNGCPVLPKDIEKNMIEETFEDSPTQIYNKYFE